MIPRSDGPSPDKRDLPFWYAMAKMDEARKAKLFGVVACHFVDGRLTKVDTTGTEIGQDMQQLIQDVEEG